MKISAHLTHPYVAAWTLSEAQLGRLRAALPGHDVVRCESEAEFRRQLADTDVALVWTFDERWLGEAPRLHWVVTPAAGRDYLQLEPRPGLAVEHSSFHGPIMAETVLGMLLGHCRGLFLAERQRNGDPWPRAQLSRAMRRLCGARVTILGFGAIGQCIARRAKAFGVEITGVSRHPSTAPDFFEPGDRWLGVDALDGVLPHTDFLVVVLPATAATDRIVSAARLGLMKPGAVLVNVGRGNAVDEAALAALLADGRLGGAYLDVYAEEPLPVESGLRSVPNVLLLPHASAIAPEYLDLFIDEFARKFHARGPSPPRP